MASVTQLHAAERIAVDTAQMYRIPEVAHLLRVSPSTVYKLMRGGQLRTVKLGRSTRITGDDLLACIRALRGDDGK
jgi:excisionase family DNA binding protein